MCQVQILNYALTLEHLEDTFYRQGLQNYTQADFVNAGFADPFYANLKEISADETTHVSFLAGAIDAASAGAAVDACVYSFPSTDPKSFVGLASILEGVGTAAYLGAAAYISNPTYLSAAGSILSIEARHSSYLRASLSQSPIPQPFENPLTFDEVYTLAAPFIVSCPAGNADKPQLPLKAFPSLTVATTGPIKSGDQVTLLTEGYALVSANNGPIYAAFITITGPIYVQATPVAGGYSVTIPAPSTGMPNGQSYLVLTGCKDAVNDDTVVAGPGLIEISNDLA